MKVVKKINHNVVLIDDEGVEKIAMGKGIDSPLSLIKLLIQLLQINFYFRFQRKTKMFSEMAAKIPIEFIEFSEEIIQFISKRIASPLDSNIYIALTDHIYFAIQRQKEDSQVTAIMLPEMKLLYPDEYETANEVVALINHRYDTELGANEVGFITMHIINAELGERNSLNSLKILEMTKTILEALENTLGYQFDKDSLTYHRMMIHIKFLVKRLIYQEESPTENIGFLQVTLKKASLIKRR